MTLRHDDPEETVAPFQETLPPPRQTSQLRGLMFVALAVLLVVAVFLVASWLI